MPWAVRAERPEWGRREGPLSVKTPWEEGRSHRDLFSHEPQPAPSPANAHLVPPAFGAILQGSLFGLAGLLPANYTAPIMSGQGLAGIFASVAMICAIASKCCCPSACHFSFCGEKGAGPVSSLTPSTPGGSELSESAFSYFITACVVIILTIICYLCLPRLVSKRRK